MKIKTDQFLKFYRLRAHGDTRKIAKLANVHYNTVANAWRDKAASPHIISVMEQYYTERENEIAQMAKPIHTFLQ